MSERDCVSLQRTQVAEAQKKAAAINGGAAPAAAPAPAPAPAAPAPAAPAPAKAPAPAPAAPAPAPVAAAAPAAPAPAPRADGRVIATPYAKQLAKDLRVDLSKVAGTGPNGRITAADVERSAGKAPAAAAPAAVAAAAPAPVAAAAAAPAPAKAAAPAKATVSTMYTDTRPLSRISNIAAMPSQL